MASQFCTVLWLSVVDPAELQQELRVVTVLMVCSRLLT